MGSAVGLREDFSASDLRVLAQRSRDAAQVRRLLALAVICAGGTRQDAALSGGVGLQTVRQGGQVNHPGGMVFPPDGCCGATRRVQRG